MRTTLKRGIGRGATVEANGRPVLPPGALSPITMYRQPEPPQTFGLGDVPHRPRLGFRRLAGRRRLGCRRRVSLVPPERRRSGCIDARREGRREAARHRAAGRSPRRPSSSATTSAPAKAKGDPSRSDTIMLVRADPDTKSVSLLSFPRDLFVKIYCPGKTTFSARINGAFSACGTKGTLETVRKLTGVPINYLITVNFRGFHQLVDSLGGVWIDVDRRYYNDRGGDFGYAAINLFPGYQKLGGYQALDFVRYRHTDSDLYRVARQQLFLRAFKDQIALERRAARPAARDQDDHQERRGRCRRQRGAGRQDRAPVRALRVLAPTRPLLPVEARGDRGDARLRSPRATGEHPEGRRRSSRTRTSIRRRRPHRSR